MWKAILIKRFNGLAIGLGSALYGLKLVMAPEIMADYRTYRVIGGVFNSPLLAYAFVLFGALKIIGVIVNSRDLKVMSIFGLFFLWTMFTTSFVIFDFYYHADTSLWPVCLIVALISGNIALSEV